MELVSLARVLLSRVAASATCPCIAAEGRSRTFAPRKEGRSRSRTVSPPGATPGRIIFQTSCCRNCCVLLHIFLLIPEILEGAWVFDYVLLICLAFYSFWRCGFSCQKQSDQNEGFFLHVGCLHVHPTRFRSAIWEHSIPRQQPNDVHGLVRFGNRASTPKT